MAQGVAIIQNAKGIQGDPDNLDYLIEVGPSVHGLPVSIPNGTTASNLILSQGMSSMTLGLQSSVALTVSIQRYLDQNGLVPTGAPISTSIAAATASNVGISDGEPFQSLIISLINGGATSTLSNVALLFKADIGTGQDGTDGSGTITTGGTAQTAFAGIAPTNGFAVYNPDAANILWVNDAGTAAANTQGSIPVPALGGYETPPFYKPAGPVSIVGANTGQKFTLRRW